MSHILPPLVAPLIAPLNERLFIDGQFVAGLGASAAVENPATRETIGQMACATIEETHVAVAAARRAFDAWSALPARARSQALHRLGAAISQDAHAMAQVLTLEQGKPVNEARGEIEKLAEACHFYAEEAVRIHSTLVAGDTPYDSSQIRHEPIGVVGAITPWNYPAELIGWKLCAALAAGCTIVIKPSELTPFTALLIAAKVRQAQIPAGVVNVVTGGAAVGQALVDHLDVAKIAFTGSSATGLAIQKRCPQIKRLSLELGGNCPLIVTEQADLAAAVKGAVRRAFRNAGQICIAINRIYVQRAVYAPFVEAMARATDALTVANGLTQPDADMGPLAAEGPLTKTRAHLQDALAQGARLVAGGAPPAGDAFTQGYFFRPTVVADCHHGMQVMSEETFGPLAGVMPFDTLAQAVTLANDTPYGLAAYVYTRDAGEMRWLTRYLDYGNVAVNNVEAGVMNAPFGGRKQSGIGVEHGRAGLFEYLQFKHVRLHINSPLEDAQ